MKSKANGGLRVWHILENYPPGYGGGAAITTREICNSLAARGHEVRVLCGDNQRAESYTIRSENDGQVQVDRVNLPYFMTEDPEGWRLSAGQWRGHESRIGRLIDGFLGKWRPDIVDYHTSRPLGEECLIRIAQNGVPIVATLHDGWLICPRVMLLRSPTSSECSGPSTIKCLECIYSHYDGSHARALTKLPWRIAKLGAYPALRLRRRAEARSKVAGAIARSEFMAEVHRPHLLGLVEHIPLGIDLEGLPEERTERPRSPLRFGFVAGFQPTKGVLQVLDAARSLKGDGLSFEVHIWGPGQERGETEIVTRNLADRVFLRGMFNPEERWRVYAEIDVALMATNVCEPLGRVPMEAGAMGAPTIGPAVGGIRETIRDEVDGLHYRFRDSRDLERQMRRVLREDGLLERLIGNLRRGLDTRTQVGEVEGFYYRVLGRGEDLTQRRKGARAQGQE